MLLHTKPRVFVEDVNVSMGLKSGVGILKYSVDIAGLNDKEVPFCQVSLLDGDNQYAVNGPFLGPQGTIRVTSPRLWWPRSMSKDFGYMYLLEVIAIII